MGIRVGIPILKLSINGKPTKRGGNALAVAQEMLSERYSKDHDLDRTKSQFNTYTGFETGAELFEYWEQEANEHRDALGRRLRKDAVIAFSAVIKPDMDSMTSMSEAEREQFNTDAIKVVCDIFKEHGLQIDATSTHRDETNLHTHIAGHDVEYKAGEKISLKLFGAFNREFPRRMRELGYDVEDITVYDSEKVKSMTEDEQKQYKAEHIKRKSKKKHGKDSNTYKAEKIAEAEKEAQKALQEAREQAQKMIDEANARVKQIENENVEKCRKREEQVKRKEKELERQKKELESEKAFVSTQKAENDVLKAQVDVDKANAENWLKTANTALQEVESVKDDYKQAYDEARRIAEGFSELKFYQSFESELKTRLEGVRYKNGQNAWQLYGNLFTGVLGQVKSSVTTPFMQYKKTVADKLEQADEKMGNVKSKLKRPLPKLNMSQNQKDDYEY